MTVSCQYCGKKIVAFKTPEEDDDVICVRCDEYREDSRRELAWEAQQDEY